MFSIISMSKQNWLYFISALQYDIVYGMKVWHGCHGNDLNTTAWQIKYCSYREM